MLTIQSSDEIFALTRKFLLMGPSKVGKTVCAATASRMCPDTIPSATKVALDDVIWVQIDENATESLPPLGISVPVVRLDQVATLKGLSKKAQDEWKLSGFLDAFDQAMEMIYERVSGDSRMIVVFDTLTELAKIVEAYHAAKFGSEPYGDYKMNKAFHGRMRNMLRSLPCGYGLLCHTKAPIQLDDKQGKAAAYRQAKAAATSVGGQETAAQLDILGSEANGYTKPLNLILPITVETKGQKRERVVWPVGNDIFPGGTRYEQFLSPKEPAHINRLYQKIEAGMKGKYA